MWSQRHRHFSIEAPRHHPPLEVSIPALVREQLQKKKRKVDVLKHLPRLQRDVFLTLSPCAKLWALSGAANRNAGECVFVAATIREFDFALTVHGHPQVHGNCVVVFTFFGALHNMSGMQAGMQAGKQADRQAGRQAGRQDEPYWR